MFKKQQPFVNLLAVFIGFFYLLLTQTINAQTLRYEVLGLQTLTVSPPPSHIQTATLQHNIDTRSAQADLAIANQIAASQLSCGRTRIVDKTNLISLQLTSPAANGQTALQATNGALQIARYSFEPCVANTTAAPMSQPLRRDIITVFAPLNNDLLLIQPTATKGFLENNWYSGFALIVTIPVDLATTLTQHNTASNPLVISSSILDKVATQISPFNPNKLYGALCADLILSYGQSINPDPLVRIKADMAQTIIKVLAQPAYSQCLQASIQLTYKQAQQFGQPLDIQYIRKAYQSLAQSQELAVRSHAQTQLAILNYQQHTTVLNSKHVNKQNIKQLLLHSAPLDRVQTGQFFSQTCPPAVKVISKSSDKTSTLPNRNELKHIKYRATPCSALDMTLWSGGPSTRGFAMNLVNGHTHLPIKLDTQTAKASNTHFLLGLSLLHFAAHTGSDAAWRLLPKVLDLASEQQQQVAKTQFEAFVKAYKLKQFLIITEDDSATYGNYVQ